MVPDGEREGGRGVLTSDGVDNVLVTGLVTRQTCRLVFRC